LSSNRVNDVGGIADKGQPIRDEAACYPQAKRIGAPRPRDNDVAEPQTEPLLQLMVEIIVGQSDDPFGFSARLGPDNGGAVVTQRPNGKRTGGEEMLFGATLVTALMSARRHNRRLAIWPAAGGDAGTFAQPRAGAVCRHKKLGRDLRTVAQPDIRAGCF